AVDISHLNEVLIREAAAKLTGTIEQVPPMHSAIKVDGQRAYNLARAGKEAKLKARQVNIRAFDITHVNLPEIEFRVVCSKGTYIRSLARDLGEGLGVGAYLSELCRTRIGEFLLEKAQTPDQLNS
ncbi:MAG: tRNA pseudouridine(55) synthase, partial [Cyclobacteriaceae bacterium]